jgi:hypothetical protein
MTGDDLDALLAEADAWAGRIDSTRGRRCLENLAAAVRALREENERHQKANLVRAVTNPLWEEHEGWIADYIGREDFDAIPWRIAQGLTGVGTERDRLAAALLHLWDHLGAEPKMSGDYVVAGPRRVPASLAGEVLEALAGGTEAGA